MADPSGPAAVLESEGITTSKPEHEDIPEDDWAEANEDGATGTEEEEADAESYDTEDEDPIDDEVCSIPPLLGALAARISIAGCDYRRGDAARKFLR